jgi:hypothetical protein
MPCCRRKAMMRSISERPATGSAGLARCAVSGRSLVPRPAVRTSAVVGGGETAYASSKSMSVAGSPCARRCSMKSDR